MGASAKKPARETALTTAAAVLTRMDAGVAAAGWRASCASVAICHPSIAKKKTVAAAKWRGRFSRSLTAPTTPRASAASAPRVAPRRANARQRGAEAANARR